MSITRIRLVVVTLIASVVAITGLVIGPSQAFAGTHGTNGQKVQVCNYNYFVPVGQGGANVTVVGWNEQHPSKFVMTPEFHLDDGKCASTSASTPGFPFDYWFVGTVYVIINRTMYEKCTYPVPVLQFDDTFAACSI